MLEVEVTFRHLGQTPSLLDEETGAQQLRDEQALVEGNTECCYRLDSQSPDRLLESSSFHTLFHF